MTPHRDRLVAGDYEAGDQVAADLNAMTKAEIRAAIDGA